MKSINRREALKQAAYIMGGAISAPVAVGMLNGCTAKPQLNWKPQFFTEEQARFVTKVADIILPKTETPGASELGVPEFMDEMIMNVYVDNKEEFQSGYTAFNGQCKAETGSSFLDLEPEAQSEYLNKINAELPEAMKNGPSFFYRLKELVIVGYFTTEVAMTTILQYKKIPTEYKGCISLEEAGGRTWAT